MDIDLVYTWVNGRDSQLQADRAAYASAESGNDVSEYSHGEARFRDNNELRYSLRSVEMNLPFVRKIFIVHTGEAPDWLKEDDKLVFVSQKDILPEKVYPSFQSDVIESYLYRIEGLAEKYIYLNDDFFLQFLIHPAISSMKRGEAGLVLVRGSPECGERSAKHSEEQS